MTTKALILLSVLALSQGFLFNINPVQNDAFRTASMRRVCYYTNWAQYRNGPAKFYPENVDPSLCTHIIYAFATMNGNHLKAFEWNDESTPWMKGMYERFHDIKSKNPQVKLLLAVGGWNLGSAPFTKMVATAASRQEFAKFAIQFMRKNNFEGLDLDWEYPANRGSPPGDKHKFTQLVQTLHDEFQRESMTSGKPKLMLTAAVAAGKDKIDTAYEIPEVSKLLDMINLMSYDLHGSWEDHTGHHSPLYARRSETGNDTYLNIDWAAKYWVQKGAPKAKMNIGVPLYGRTFKLPYNPSDTSIGCRASGAGQAGTYTGEAGFMAYYEICELLKSGVPKHYVAEQKVPYLVKGTLWAGYDDPDSIRTKVQYIKQGGFGGVMVWALDLDDFSGMCGQGKFPLMNAINDELNRISPTVQTIPPQPPSTQQPVTRKITQPPPTQPPQTQPPQTQPPQTQPPQTQPPQTQPPQPQTTQAPQPTTGPGGYHHNIVPVRTNEFDCSGKPDAFYPSPSSCSSYYVCAGGNGFKSDCHVGLKFNPQTLYCDFKDHVKCYTGTQHSTQPHMQPPTQPPNQPPTKLPTTQAPPPTTTRTMPPFQPTTPKRHHEFCEGKPDGYYRDPKDCQLFYQCSYEHDFHESCSFGTVFNEGMKSCDWPANTPGCP